MYKTLVKPIGDFVTALFIFVLLLPVFLITTIVLAVVNKGNPFFVQRRPGKNERIFSIYKFRTMSNATDAQGNLLPDAARLTTFGKLVRSSSIDEIPQLINVLIGDMSLVGPRPLLPQYLPLYTPEQRKRHLVKPGITGWAQVNGRNAISWEKKFEMDVYYVERLNFVLDLKILLHTFLKVVGRKDINTEGTVTTEPFKGTEK
ncbi:MAG TPA: lipid carrier--UDP-N-acetylgalactosaminyltransferase [Flavobacteriaceae bacterium]|nr:lipid carrier--UDP-N-acetylgalactosaminyltransferase [Flavobacteriaceae bacterium]HBR55597.1 lipid carrier--UDP-N-acetylgalactosaminyltransferase [Flavobacteriaceae bacterium]